METSLENFKLGIDKLASAEYVQKPLIPVKKNILLSYVSDATGCGHIRNVFPVNYLNAVYGKNQDIVPIISPHYIWQNDILLKTRSIYFQRHMSPDQLNVVRQYKSLQPQFGYKMVWDIDDFIWGKNEKQGGDSEDGVPSYNFGWPGITFPIKEASVEIMKLMDLLTVSTEYLKEYIHNVLKVETPITVVPNAIPKFFWGNKKRMPKTEYIKKPKVVYTGSPTHYNNQDKLKGDFDSSWLKWVLESVNKGKIDFWVMGGLPFFFESIKDKIHIVDWVNSYQYHHAVKDINADFGIMPLVPNNFNYSKSDIKAIELYSCGAIAMGTVFSNGKPSPYDNNPVKIPFESTAEEIDSVFESLRHPEKYNAVVNEQYRKMNAEHRYLEDPVYVKLLTDSYV